MIAVNLSMNDDMVCSGCVVNQEKQKKSIGKKEKKSLKNYYYNTNLKINMIV